MAQNRSHAVMAQRVEAHDSLDDFPTPPWATRALLQHVVVGHGWSCDQIRAAACWEPACNRGHMVGPLMEWFGLVIATDVHDYGMGGEPHDFLQPYVPGSIDRHGVGWIITNPPFAAGAAFVLRALQIARQGVAVLVRTSFAESIERWGCLFRDRPPLIDAVFTERVIMHKGVLRDPSKQYWDAGAQAWRRPSTATSYSWMVWPGRDVVRTRTETIRLWIPPCRRELERPGDYPVNADERGVFDPEAAT